MRIRTIPVAICLAAALTGCTVQFETPDDSTITESPDGYQAPEGTWSEPPTSNDAPYIAPAPVETTGASMEEEANIAADEAAAILQDRDSSFKRPPVVFYDDGFVVGGEVLDPDTAAWYDGKIYIDPDTFYGTRKDGNFYYTIGHEMGHGWEEHFDPSYPVGLSSELFADCMAGAIGSAAGWDVDAMIDYARFNLGEDKIHGDGEDRYAAITTGATGGPDACHH